MHTLTKWENKNKTLEHDIKFVCHRQGVGFHCAFKVCYHCNIKVHKRVGNLAQVYEGQLGPSQELNRLAASFEQKTFTLAHSKDDYIRRISLKLVDLERKRQPVLRAASGLQKQIQMGCHEQPVNAVQAIHGCNSSITAVPQVASMMSSPGRGSSQLQSLPMTPPGSSLVPNQHMAYPFAPNVHIEVKQEQPEVIAKQNQILSSPPTSVTLLAPCVQHSQRMIQSVATQNQKQLPAMQMHSTIFSGCNPTSVAQSQGQTVVQPNGQYNHLLRPNDRGTDTLPQQQMMMNQQGLLGVNQDQMDMQRYQMLLAQQAIVAKMMTGHPRGHNNQQNAGLTVALQSPLNMYKQEAKKQIKMEPQHMALPHQLITVSQQSGSPCAIPKTLAMMGSAREVDWREEMFQQIKPLKDAYFSELVELDRMVVVPKITKKQFDSLSKDKAEQYRYRANLKKKTEVMLDFLQFQKSNITENLTAQIPMFVKTIQDLVGLYRKSKSRKAEVDRGRQSQISLEQPQIINLTSNQVPSSGGTSSQQKQQQPVDSLLRQNVFIRTPAAPQQNHSNLLLGVENSCFPEKSPGSLQSFPTNKLQEFCTPSPVTELGAVEVSSPSASVKSISPSPVAKLSAVKVASPSASVKSTSPSPVAKSSTVKVASPSSSMKSTSPSPIAKQGAVKVASPSTSVKSTLPSPVAKPGVLKVASFSASVKSTFPSPFAKSDVTQAASPHASVKSMLPSPVTNSGVVPVASPCTSVNSTSSESVESISALLVQNNVAAAAAETSTRNVSKQVIPTKPIMLASLLQSETADCQGEDQEHGGDETPVAKKPIDRLVDAVRSSSLAVLCSSANSICLVLSINDRVPHKEIGAFQDWAFFGQQGGSSPVNKMKRIFESTSTCPESPPLGSMDGSCVTLFDCNASEVESNTERGAKRQKTQNAKDALIDEINSANSMLIDTAISITDDNITDGFASSSGGTLIKLSYTATSLAPELKSLFAVPGMSIVMPMKLLVPTDYPRSSPVLVDEQGDEQLRKRFSDISSEADVAFRHTLRTLPEPRSIGEMARAWDACVRRAVIEFARQRGGGTFSSRYGRWERCDGA